MQRSTAAGRAVRQPIEEIDFVLLVELEQGIVLAASAVGADATGVQGPPSEALGECLRDPAPAGAPVAGHQWSLCVFRFH